LSEESGLSQRLVLWGASGHGKVILDIARAMGVFDVISFIDDAGGESAHEFCGCPALGSAAYLQSLHGSTSATAQFLVSIGSNKARAACFQKALDHGLLPATLIHPCAVISESARLDVGTVVMARVVINPDARIGRNCIVNTAAVIEHDCHIGDHVHLSPGVLLAGGVTVGSHAHIGIGAVVLPGIEIGDFAVVGAGAVVVKSVPPGVVVAGVPARNLAQPR